MKTKKPSYKPKYNFFNGLKVGVVSLLIFFVSIIPIFVLAILIKTESILYLAGGLTSTLIFIALGLYVRNKLKILVPIGYFEYQHWGWKFSTGFTLGFFLMLFLVPMFFLIIISFVSAFFR